MYSSSMCLCSCSANYHTVYLCDTVVCVCVSLAIACTVLPDAVNEYLGSTVIPLLLTELIHIFQACHLRDAVLKTTETTSLK